ncbi:MAG: Bug family tripartite tricarboxylate transporter substrate binding protein [Xanthobacteraceae bacterium]
MTRVFQIAAAIALIAVSLSTSLEAQDWPTRPIRIIVGFGAGGGTDIAARIVADPLSKALGQPVVVENRVGAGGTAAAEQVAKTAKDGYTALMMSNAHAVTPAMYKALRYDPIKDFQMVSMVGTAGLMLVVAPGFPAKDLKGVIAQAKASPGKLNFGSPGVGTTQHFAAEYMKQLAGLNIQHIPYKGTPASLTGLMGGEVHMIIELIQTVQGQVQAGKLRPIAVTSAKRFPTVPNIPTFAESGLPGYDVTSWYGLSFPAGTPALIVEKTNKAMRALLATETVRKQILKVGALVRSSTPDELKTHIAGEIARWQAVREKAGMKQQ